MSAVSLHSASVAFKEEAQPIKRDSDCVKTAKKIAWYVGHAFLWLAGIALIVTMTTFFGTAPFFAVIGPLALKIVGIEAAIGASSAIFGSLLSLPHWRAEDEKKMESLTLADLTQVVEFSGHSYYYGPSPFSWNNVLKYYGAANDCCFWGVRHGRRNFDQLKERLQKEIQEAQKPFDSALKICESLHFTMRKGQLSVKESEVKQIVLESLFNRVRNMPPGEILSFYSSYDSEHSFCYVQKFLNFGVISRPFYDLLLEAKNVRTELNRKIKECEDQFLAKETALQALRAAMPQENAPMIAQHLQGLQAQLEQFQQEKEARIAGFRQDAQVQFDRIEQAIPLRI